MCSKTERGFWYKNMAAFAAYLDVPDSDVCIVDDNEETCALNPEVAIRVLPWKPSPLSNPTKNDIVLLSLKDTIQHLKGKTKVDVDAPVDKKVARV